jgi:hypothetical protein
MNALQTATASTTPSSTRVAMIGVLRALLLSQAILGLGLAIFLSLVAESDAGRANETTIRFAAGGAFLFAIFAAVASRGARRRRSWAWTMAAVLQLVLAIGAGVAVMTVEWHPVYLVAFGLAAVVMLVLSTATVRRALGQA